MKSLGTKEFRVEIRNETLWALGKQAAWPSDRYFSGKNVYEPKLFFLGGGGSFVFLGRNLRYVVSQARSPVGAVGTSLHLSHSKSGSQLHLRPTPQLTSNAGSLTH